MNSETLVTGVDFVTLPTKDFEAAVEFYGTTLGLPCSARYGKMPGAEFETGTLTIAILESEPSASSSTPTATPSPSTSRT